MTAIGNSVENIYSELGINRPAPEVDTRGRSELGQAEFLKLLTVQLANQDPLAPTDSKEFITQMSQFSSVDSLQTLVTKFDDLSSSLTSNQALQASSLVGRHVLIPSSVGIINGESGMSGQLNIDSHVSGMRFEVKNANGEVVRRVDVGDKSPGDVEFYWDGRNEEGELLDSAQYEIVAYGIVNGQTEQIATSIRAQVQSVNLEGSGGGIMLNLVGLGKIDFNDVKEVG